jgi:hypothetical protein
MMRYDNHKPKHETSSKELRSLASRLIKDPSSATPEEIQRLAGCVLTQSPDRPPKVQTK